MRIEIEKFGIPVRENKKILGEIYSPKELLEIFPQAKPYIENKLQVYLRKKQDLLNQLREDIRKYKDNICELILIRDLYKEKLKKVNKEITRLKRYFSSYKGEKEFQKVDIDELKTKISIIEVFQDLYPDIQLKKQGKTYMCLCPFHLEKHPSFALYPESNRFFCFGCGVKGDVIKLVMVSKNFSFKEAINYLKEIF